MTYSLDASKFIELFHSFERTEIKKIVIHSFDTAKATVAIAKRIDLDLDLCNVYMAGLAHDVGLVLYGDVKNMNRFRELVGEMSVSSQGVITFDIDQLLDTIDKRNDHAIVSYAMIKDVLPDELAKAVLYHHNPWEGKSERVAKLSYMIHVADIISNVYRKNAGEMESYAMEDLVKIIESMYIPFQDIKDAAKDLVSDLLDFSMVADFKPHLPHFVNVNSKFDMEKMISIFKIFVYLVDFRSPFTRNHSFSIATLARDIGGEMLKSAFDANVMYIAGLIHDLGKLSTPISILHKPGSLNRYEGMVMKRHVADTYRMTYHMDEISEIIQVAVLHHERLDGSGYPYGLKAHDISMKARILQVCDVFVALTEDRPYREGLDYKSALEIIEREVRNGKLDPDVFSTLKSMVKNGYTLPKVSTVIDEIFKDIS